MKKLFLVDAYALIFRSYYAFINRPMRNSEGLNTSAIFGFTKFINEMIRRENPHFLGVAFDPRGGNFRHELYPAYKANRSATPEDIIASVPYIKEILEAMRIPIIEIPGYEADDVIGTLSRKAAEDGFEVFMVTPDKDFGQLIRPTVHIYKQLKAGEGMEIIDCAKIESHYGITDPTQVIDILALWGDASDNIPGVPGIGEKSAIKLVREFGTVENLIEHRGRLSGKQRENIEKYIDQIILAKKLATIELNVPVDFCPDELIVENPNKEKLAQLYRNLGFRIFLQDIEAGKSSAGVSSQVALSDAYGHYTTVNSDDKSTSTSDTLSNNSDSLSSRQVNVNIGSSINAAVEFQSVSPNQDSVQRDLFGCEVVAVTNRKEKSATQQAESYGQIDLFEAQNYNTIATTPHTYHVVNSEDELDALCATLSRVEAFCFDTETTGFDIFGSHLVGISFAINPFEAWYVPCNRENTPAVVETLKPIFANANIAKIGQNLKFDIMVMRNVGVDVCGRLYDTMLIHYLLDPESRHGMDHLARTFLSYSPVPIEELIGKGTKQLTMDMVSIDRVSEYAAEDADVTLRLFEMLWPKLEAAELVELYEKIEEPLIRVLADIEMTGVKIDIQSLAESGAILTAELIGLERRIREIVSDPTLNVNSAKQLGEALFVRLKIDPKPKMTKTKQYRTDEEYLQSLYDRHEIVGLILEYRGLRKLLSTYVEALPQLVNPITGRIHTSYNQAVTATGRLSSTNPNLQNIPIRDERGREIRKAFIPSDSDHLLLSADYSQVELRLMAHLSGDEAMLKAFIAGEDIHTATASHIFGVSESEVTREQRRRAKTANFGIIYGISVFGLGQRLNIPRTEAKEIIDGYFASYPGIKIYMDSVIEQARMDGFVTTLFGRKRMLPDINSGNSVVRGLAERNAINAPIQGGAADIMKIAMSAVHKELTSSGLQSKIIMQVHDEIVIDMLRSEETEVREIVVRCMEGAANLLVKLVAECGVGENWVDAH